MKYLLLATLVCAQMVAAQSATGSGNRPVMSGVYRASNTQNTPDQPSGAGVRAGHFYLTFFPDGRVKRGEPQQGLDGFDDAYWMSMDLRSGDKRLIWHWGIYRVSGEEGRIQFTTGESWNLNTKGYPKTIEARGRTYERLDPGTGLRLTGLYKSDHGRASIAFLPDGRVTEQGVGSDCKSSPSFSYGGAIPDMHTGSYFCSPDPRSGRYRIANYTLTLSFADGSNPTFAFWTEPASDPSEVRIVYIADFKYERAQ